MHQLILTSAWGTIFTLNALLAFGKMESVLLQPWQYETTNYVLLVCGAILTSWYPNRVRSRAADVGEETAVAAAFAALQAWQDRAGEPAGLDLLVNNAGLADPVSGPLEALSLAGWRRWLDGHLTGAFICTRAAIPGLRMRRGAIVNIASTRALQSEPHCEAYAAAKGGLLAFTHAAAISLGPLNRVNAVSPGWIETGPLRKSAHRRVPDHRPIDQAQHAVGRVGEPADIVAAVRFLASPSAGFITGQNLVVDGGMTRTMIYAE